MAKRFKSVLESFLKSAEERSRRLVGIRFVAAEKIHDQRWNQRPRQQVGREHREHHGFRHRYEQITSYAGQEKHGHKYNADRERRNERRYGDLLGTVENSGLQLLVHSEVALDVFDLDGGVVHQNSYR